MLRILIFWIIFKIISKVLSLLKYIFLKFLSFSFFAVILIIDFYLKQTS